MCIKVKLGGSYEIERTQSADYFSVELQKQQPKVLISAHFRKSSTFLIAKRKKLVERKGLIGDLFASENSVFCQFRTG